jgi:hypothetical protein
LIDNLNLALGLAPLGSDDEEWEDLGDQVHHSWQDSEGCDGTDGPAEDGDHASGFEFVPHHAPGYESDQQQEP